MDEQPTNPAMPPAGDDQGVAPMPPTPVEPSMPPAMDPPAEPPVEPAGMPSEAPAEPPAPSMPDPGQGMPETPPVAPDPGVQPGGGDSSNPVVGSF